MPFPLAALIPAAISLVGGILKKKGEQKQAEGQYEQGRPGFERGQATQAARSQLVSSILRGLGIGGSIDPALMSRLGTPAAYPKRPSGGWQGAVGGALGGVAPHLYRSMNPESFGGPGDTPFTDAAEQGEPQLPPVPWDVNAGTGPTPVEAETISAGDNDVEDYLSQSRRGWR